MPRRRNELDAVSKLHIYCQRHTRVYPTINIQKSGADHCPTWTTRCPVCSEVFIRKGLKKEVEQLCAAHILNDLQKEDMDKALLGCTLAPVEINTQEDTIVYTPALAESKEREDNMTHANQQNKKLEKHDEGNQDFCAQYFIFFQRLGLATPEMKLQHTGTAHDGVWHAWMPETRFTAKTSAQAKALCAKSFLDQMRVIQTRDEDLPVFEVKPNAIRHIEREDDMPDPVQGVEALDIEWNCQAQNVAETDAARKHKYAFVCGAIARSEKEIYLYTDYDLLISHLKTTYICATFAMEQDVKYFPEAFAGIHNLIDVRSMLPVNTFSQTVGLASMVRLTFHQRMNKELQTSFQDAESLTEAQKQYVAADALAILMLYHQYVHDL
ncbi:MAG TPA: putative dsRNA-binding protein [Chlamydiales bacterium]|nr:putative dsRNA-binding protein [Chlamydiales bacterium]